MMANADRYSHSVICAAFVCLLHALIAHGCDVTYNDGQKPLLFGGVNEPGRCRGCNRSDPFWIKYCQLKQGESWGACSKQQAARSLEYAKTLGRGQALLLSPCNLVPYLQGRTLWLLGDSHTKSFYRALQCFLIDFWQDQAECEASTDAQAVQQLKRLPGASGDSQCIHLRGPAGGRICIVHVVLGSSLVNNKQVAEGGVLPLLRSKFAKPEDIFVINFSTWHKKKPEWWADYRPALAALGKYFQDTRNQWPHLLFRETPAKHAPVKNKCQAATGYLYDRTTGALEPSETGRSDGWSLGVTENTIIREILAKYGIPIVPAFNITVELSDNHVGKAMNPEMDCLHYCHPGVPEMAVWRLFDALRSTPERSSHLADKVQQEDGEVGVGQQHECVKSFSARFRV